jgi:hypothetical protein
MISKLLDRLSEFLAHRKGLLPIMGLLLISCNLLVQFTMPGTLLAASNLLLHAGLILAILGFMLSRAL